MKNVNTGTAHTNTAIKIPTDLEVLSHIYDTYYEEFISFNSDAKAKAKNDPTLYLRIDKVYVPIDVDKIGAALGVEGDIIFGRRYYHLTLSTAIDSTILRIQIRRAQKSSSF